MLDIFELLEELNYTYPTPGGVNHNVTKEFENSININIFVNNSWETFTFPRDFPLKFEALDVVDSIVRHLNLLEKRAKLVDELYECEEELYGVKKKI